MPFLEEVLKYDRAVLDVALKGEERLVAFRADPLSAARARLRTPSRRRRHRTLQIRLTPIKSPPTLATSARCKSSTDANRQAAILRVPEQFLSVVDENPKTL